MVIGSQEADNSEQHRPCDGHDTRLVNLTPTNRASVQTTSQSRRTLPSLNRFKVKR
jgi:hypothetical protein